MHCATSVCASTTYPQQAWQACSIDSGTCSSSSVKSCICEGMVAAAVQLALLKYKCFELVLLSMLNPNFCHLGCQKL